MLPDEFPDLLKVRCRPPYDNQGYTGGIYMHGLDDPQQVFPGLDGSDVQKVGRGECILFGQPDLFLIIRRGIECRIASLVDHIDPARGYAEKFLREIIRE